MVLKYTVLVGHVDEIHLRQIKIHHRDLEDDNVDPNYPFNCLDTDTDMNMFGTQYFPAILYMKVLLLMLPSVTCRDIDE